MKKICFAGGCFWGVEEYFSRINGVEKTTVGYANSSVGDPTYEDVCKGITDAAETVYIEYDEKAINLVELLEYYFKIIDPISVNKQGSDRGTQYRTGVYYIVKEDIGIINDYIEQVQKKFTEKIAVEITELKNFFDAENYHQKYLKKNPNGYCHIDLSSAKD